MRIIPIPDNIVLEEHQVKSTLGPPVGMESKDCETVEVVHSLVRLPSGQEVPTVMAVVWMNAEELEAIKEFGGMFWVEFLGSTFPPVWFGALKRLDKEDSDGTR